MRLYKLHIVALIMSMLPMVVKAQQCIPESFPGLVRFVVSSPDAVAYTWLVNGKVARDSVPVVDTSKVQPDTMRFQTFDTLLNAAGTYRISVIPVSDSGVWGDTISSLILIDSSMNEFTMQANWTNNSLLACLNQGSAHTNVNIGISLKSQSYISGDTFDIVYSVDGGAEQIKEFDSSKVSFNIDANNFSSGKVHNFEILRVLYGKDTACVDNYKGNPPTLALDVRNTPIVDILNPDTVKCEGEPFEFTTVPGFTYDSLIWNGPLHDTTNTFSGIASKTDTVKVLAYKNKCVNSAEVVLTVHLLPRFRITTSDGDTIKKDTMLCGDEYLTLEAGNLEGNFVGATYEWATNERSQSIKFNALAPDNDSIKYHLWSTVTSEYGCIFSDTIVIDRCEPPAKNNISTVFTPNGDGKNDTWVIPYLEFYPNATVDVYDRWGRLVFHSENGYNKPWDGRANGKVLPMDNYYYIIQLDSKSKPIVGNITILR